MYDRKVVITVLKLTINTSSKICLMFVFFLKGVIANLERVKGEQNFK